MAGVNFTLTVNDAEIRAGLRRVLDAATDMTPLMTEIGGDVETSTVLRFATNVAPDGTPWAPSERAKNTGTPTLVMSSNLRDSIHFIAYSDAVEVGSNLIYAAVHQVGATITAKGDALAFHMWNGAFVQAKSVEIPQRAYLGLSANDNAAILDTVGNYMVRAAAGGAR